ncbi:hypothetical protein D3OALGA1CA_545 [Olavius algarvensis associated proteobacterium Delta 3]|nr:hypothetical protein D3OALGA1CA_545 [Olavius algarvensis associated proteobacterium Delta 3]
MNLPVFTRNGAVFHCRPADRFYPVPTVRPDRDTASGACIVHPGKHQWGRQYRRPHWCLLVRLAGFEPAAFSSGVLLQMK